MSSKVPTPIVDKNGKQTTVHKNLDGTKTSRSIPSPASVSDAPELKLDGRLSLVENGRVSREKNTALLVSEGLDPFSADDSEFGSDFVYCDGHVGAHTSGWCSVPLRSKIPLSTNLGDHSHSQEDANDEARNLGLKIYGDKE